MKFWVNCFVKIDKLLKRLNYNAAKSGLVCITRDFINITLVTWIWIPGICILSNEATREISIGKL